MGCASSKVMHMQAEKEGWIEVSEPRKSVAEEQSSGSRKRAFCDHRVALTSSTYGILDPPKEIAQDHASLSGPRISISTDPSSRILRLRSKEEMGCSDASCVTSRNYHLEEGHSRISLAENTEVINTWELMEGLEEETSLCYSNPASSPPKKLLKSVSLPAHRGSALCIISAENTPAGFHIYVKDMHSSNVSLATDKENVRPPNASTGKMVSMQGRRKKGALFRAPARNFSLAMAERENSSSVLSPCADSLVGSSQTPKKNSCGCSRICSEREEFESKIPSKVESPCSPVLNRKGSAKRSLADGPLPSGKMIRTNASDSKNPGYGRNPSSRNYFDPELIATIERAFEQITEEEWDYKDSQTNSGSKSVQISPAKTQSIKSDKGGAESKGNKIPISSKAANLGRTEPKEDDEKICARIGKEFEDPFEGFKCLCPPGGEEKAVVYYTSLRGIRKTYEECNELLTLIRSFHIQIDERDISMHSEFKQELKDLAGIDCSVPRLFIKGRYIGGLTEAAILHDDGKLGNLVKGIAQEDPFQICDGCGGARFILCLDCSGSCKIRPQNGDLQERCSECNENGLVRCPICC